MTIPRVSRELVETRAKEQLDIDVIKEAWVDMALENPTQHRQYLKNAQYKMGS